MIVEKIRSLILHAFVYGAPGLISRLSGLITFPVLSRSMGVEQFGTLDYLMTISNLIAVLAIFGLDSAAVRFYFSSDDKADRFRELSRVLSLQSIPVLLLVAGSLVALLAAAGQDEPSAAFAAALVLAQSALMAPIAHFQYIMIWRDRKADYLISTLGQAALTVVALVWTCYGHTATAIEILVVLFIMRALTFAHGYWVNRAEFRITLERRGTAPMLRYALPIGIVGTLGAVLPLVERQSILSLLTEADLGTYAAAARLGTLILLPIAAFQIVWVPFALAHYRDPAAETIYKAVLKLFAIGGLAATFVLTACADPLLRLLTTPEYFGARVAVFPICFGLVVKTIGDIVQVGIDISRKSHLKLYAFGLMTAASLVLAPLLTYFWGIAGAAWATAFAFSFKAVAEYHLAQSAHRLNWQGNRILALTVTAGALGLAAELLAARGSTLSAVTALVGAILIAVIGWVATFDAEERRQLRELLQLGQVFGFEKRG